MFIKRLSLKKHPLIKDCDPVFSVPDGILEGSGINFIVGGFGSGKTKFLDTFTSTSDISTPII